MAARIARGNGDRSQADVLYCTDWLVGIPSTILYIHPSTMPVQLPSLYCSYDTIEYFVAQQECTLQVLPSITVGPSNEQNPMVTSAARALRIPLTDFC